MFATHLFIVIWGLVSAFIGVESGCSVGGITYSEGQTFTAVTGAACDILTCVNGAMKKTDTVCYENKRCYQIGETYVRDCRTFQCKNVTFFGVSMPHMASVSAKCQDKDGSCKGNGERVVAAGGLSAAGMACTCYITSPLSPTYKCSN